MFYKQLTHQFSPTISNNVLIHQSLRIWGVYHFSTLLWGQPSKLKFLLGCDLATNSLGLGRLIYKSSCQLQNSRCHIVTKMVATWGVGGLNTKTNYYKINLNFIVNLYWKVLYKSNTECLICMITKSHGSKLKLH